MIPGNHTFLKEDELKHSRGSGRENRFTDVFNRDMDRSDPLILSYNLDARMAQRALHKHDVPQVVLDLMADPIEEPENV